MPLPRVWQLWETVNAEASKYKSTKKRGKKDKKSPKAPTRSGRGSGKPIISYPEESADSIRAMLLSERREPDYWDTKRCYEEFKSEHEIPKDVLMMYAQTLTREELDTMVLLTKEFYNPEARPGEIDRRILMFYSKAASLIQVTALQTLVCHIPTVVFFGQCTALRCMAEYSLDRQSMIERQ